MATTTSSTLSLAVITSTMPTGYRRGGIGFVHGENTIEVNGVQLAQIKQDPHLLLQSIETIASGSDHTTQGSMDDERLGESVISPSLDDVTLDLAHAPEALHAIISQLHTKQCQAPLTKKPNCDAFDGLTVSGAERDAAWAWYKAHVIQDSSLDPSNNHGLG